MTKKKTKLIGGFVEPHIKSIIDNKLLVVLGISQSEYLRQVVIRDLENRGFLKP